MARGKKYGGRKAGTPNKRASVQEICERHGVNPIEVLVEMCKPIEPGLPPQEIMSRVANRFAAAKELCQYLYPKQKALEVSGPNGEAVKVESQSQSSFKDQLVADFLEIIKHKSNERQRS